MNNAWNNADKVRLVREGIKSGISVAIGGVGGFVSSLVGEESTTRGLLASLGFKTIDRALSKYEMLIADKSARLLYTRLLNKQYLVNVYDFKERHNLR